jgi:Polysaccharide lyase
MLRIAITTGIIVLFGASMGDASAAYVHSAPTSKPRSKPNPYVVGNFDTCDFSQWQDLQGPEGSFKIVRSPRVEGRCAAAITVGPWAANGLVNPDADGAALRFDSAPYGTDGHKVWIHFSAMLGTGYRATTGDWNYIAQWHNDKGWQKFGSQIPFEYSNLCWMVQAKNGQSRIEMRIVGGSSLRQRTIRVIGPRIRTNHWYDFLARVTWSADAGRGKVTWWLDGKRLYAKHVPTLFTRPDGSVSTVYFIEDNYRRHASWDSTIYYDGTRIAGSRAAVGY